MDLPKQKMLRNRNIHYTNGSFFITICTDNHKCVLGHNSAGMGLCPIRLSDIGNVIESELKNLQSRFVNVKIPVYCIMPNHIHFIIDIDDKHEMTTHKTAGRMGQSPIPAEYSITTAKAINRLSTKVPSVPTVIGAFKSITTKTVNQNNRTPGEKLWQSGYWDDKIRSINDYAEIRGYINENPFKWAEDRYFTEP